ncbi:MAG: exonuclease subunit SbcD [Dehalococcoidia bacterium]|nr:exonuclease subunit SbcD [Dehalococcoidia bacterium]
MRVLHTSDWHVGRAVRGRSREEEHRAVFAEMAGIVREEGVDLVLVAGDIFDHQSPSATAEEIVYKALLEFTSAGAQVVLISGNHDNAERLDAIRPLLNFANIHTGAKLKRPEDGGCVEVTIRNGETARVALMPWPSRSKIVSADDLMNKEQAQHQSQYWDRCHRILKTLCGGFNESSVNMVLAHLVITGALLGGGERASETIEDYWVPPESLNLNAQYVALGHIHKPQGLNLMWPAWYCGSPMQLDFGEEKDAKSLLLFDAKAGSPIRTPRAIELKSGRRMITVRGDLQQLSARKTDLGDAYLRVYLNEALRPGLADEVRELLPNAVEVKIDAPSTMEPSLVSREGMQPRDLLASYFEHANVRDESALKLFDDLVEEDDAPVTA